eukprot:UN26211
MREVVFKGVRTTKCKKMSVVKIILYFTFIILTYSEITTYNTVSCFWNAGDMMTSHNDVFISPSADNQECMELVRTTYPLAIGASRNTATTNCYAEMGEKKLIIAMPGFLLVNSVKLQK